jgi:hypothetical protein
MRTAAPPRGLTAEHLAFNLPQGEACSAVHERSELLSANIEESSLAHQLEVTLLPFADLDRCRIFARNGEAQTHRAFFAFGFLERNLLAHKPG